MRQVAGISLQRKLLLWLLLPQLILWLTGGFLAWRIALQNGEKGIDQTLTQSVRALARQIKPIGDGLLVDFPKAAQDILEQDPKDRITYMVSSPPGRFLLGNAQLPPPPEQSVALGEPLLYHARMDDRSLRVALLEVDYGSEPNRQRLRVQVAQSLTVRERIAQELLHQMVLPMGLMGLALSALVYAGVLRGLQPLKRLETQIERAGQQRRADHEPLAHIELTEAPLEVHSLASTINRLLDAVALGQGKEKRFLNDAAHQLRTPLAGLQAQVEAWAQAVNSPAAAAAWREKYEPNRPLAGDSIGSSAILIGSEKINHLRDAVRRTSQLANQLLALSRADARSLDAQPLLRVDLKDLCETLLEVYLEAAERKQIDLGLDVQAVHVDGHEWLLRELLCNLLDNALKYTPDGGAVTLRCAPATAQRAPFLEVEDNGPGVPPAQRLRVLERFYRVPGTATEGNGLGLAIANEIARVHRSELVIGSGVRGQGTRATLVFVP